MARSHVLYPVMKLDAFLVNKQKIETKFSCSIQHAYTLQLLSTLLQRTASDKTASPLKPPLVLFIERFPYPSVKLVKNIYTYITYVTNYFFYREAMQAFSRLASYPATRTNSPKSKVVGIVPHCHFHSQCVSVCLDMYVCIYNSIRYLVHLFS